MPDSAKKLQRASIVMISATALSNLSMVVFHRIMSSSLADGYGRLISLIAIANVLASGTMGANTFLVKEFSRDTELKGPAAVKGRLYSLFWPLGWVILILAAVLGGLGPWVIAYLHLPSFSEYALIVGLFLMGILLLVLRAALQGIHRFQSLGFSVSTDAVGRVAGGAVFTRAFGVSGGILGALAGQAVGMLVAIRGLAGLGAPVEPPPYEWGRSSRRARFKELTGDTLALCLFSVMSYLDFFITKHYYGDQGASDYGRAALVAKSFLYLAAALNMVLLPAVASAREGGRDPKKLLLRFLGAMALVNLAGLAFVWVFTDFCLRTLCGKDPAFLALSPLVRILSLATVTQALFQMVLFYLLAMRKKAAVWIMAVTVPCYYALLVFRHQDPFDVAACLGLTAFLGLVAGMAVAFVSDEGGKVHVPGA